MGVDPGVRGGVVVLAANGAVKFCRGLSPDEETTEGVLRDACTELWNYGGFECFLEKVGYIRGDGGQGAFTFGNVNGFIRGFLRASRVTIYAVPPQLWQAKLECLTGGDKNVSKARAQSLFPEVKVAHAIADALLIAQYGRQTLFGGRGGT